MFNCLRTLRPLKPCNLILLHLCACFLCFSSLVALAQTGQNKATPVSHIKVAPGFKVELLYSVPAKDQGSWVNLCVDNKGRILVSDQFGGLYRMAAPALGAPLEPTSIEAVPAPIRAVNGMVWAFGALYVGVNDYEQKISSGLYRLTDSTGDDQLDKVELLREVKSRGDHGVHAVVPTPDGQSLFLITGNNSKPPIISPTSPVTQVWGEDHLLPSMPDGRGHNRGVLAPGGIIYKVSPDGKQFEAYASGFRNIFGGAVNRDGELFTYDADMEYDFNTPWYRPTRICLVTSGAEFGWRNGAGKRPVFYPDNLPGILDIGPGSPTGMTFGYGAKFPAKYQDALYALDWSWGKLYAVHLKPNGSGYTATKEEFVTGAPLPITDAIIHPGDGAMYFTIGGRRVQSGLYRVTYVGNESTDIVTAKPATTSARETRHMLEDFHGEPNPRALDVAWPLLDHSDRLIRWSARMAIEHQPTQQWADMALEDSNTNTQVEALLALARMTGICPKHRTDQSPPVDKTMGRKLIDALLGVDTSKLKPAQQLTFIRTLQITLIRFGRPDEVIVKEINKKLDPLFPANTFEQNWLLCETLAWLESSTVAAKTLTLIEDSSTQEEQLQYARSLRMLRAGWTTELRTRYFNWFLKASNYRGGASFDIFLKFIRDDAVASLDPNSKTALAALLATKPERKSVIANLGAIFEGREPQDWSLATLSATAKSDLQGRDYENGKRMFAAAACYACHRFNNQGGITGPDLTSAGRRYSPHDLLDQIINPSKVINDQFSAVVVITTAGVIHTGVVVNLNGDSLMLNTDLTNPNQQIRLNRNEIDEINISKVSPMPKGLLAKMTSEEILDLVAYVISAGDSKHELFK
ncbi:MAG: c-type cytochrome [Planctomycetaceae bacterium]|nr:c-type cytochrome [Planctomycetaceae bacterium]